MISLEKIMTRDVITVRESADIFEAIRLMADGNITGLPVVDDNNNLVGIVTERDVMTRLINDLQTNGKVSDYMTTEVVRFNINDKLADVITALEINRFRRVPIESQGKLVGIISRRDIITYLFAIELQQRGHEAVAVGGKYFD